jgi:hypothetical protein
MQGGTALTCASRYVSYMRTIDDVLANWKASQPLFLRRRQSGLHIINLESPYFLAYMQQWLTTGLFTTIIRILRLTNFLPLLANYQLGRLIPCMWSCTINYRRILNPASSPPGPRISQRSQLVINDARLTLNIYFLTFNRVHQIAR